MLLICTWVTAEPEFRLELIASRPADRGENWGSLFEIVDSVGDVIAGAGYLGAYNTFPRSDREELHIFIREQSAIAPLERLPDIPGSATGYYPFQVAGELYCGTRNGNDARVHHWDSANQSWRTVNEVPNGCERVAGKLFSVSGDEVRWDGRVLLAADASDRFGEHYFANGKLVLRVFRTDGGVANSFCVYAWTPEEGQAPELLADKTFTLPQPREFVYAFGQWRDHILACTNMGGVYRLRPDGWDVLRRTDPSVSYQVYCGLNYRDSLLLGQYPTGEIFTYEGKGLVHREGWPPVLSGVSRSAREAQTLAIYNGEVYIGVWPWGEIWRFDGKDWHFVARAFQHPPLTDDVIHPYESETKQVDKVYNLWGQRVTGLIPYRGSLIVTTSSKGGAPWDPKFAFLSEEKRRDYGAIYRLRLPGQFSVHAPVGHARSRIELEYVNGAIAVRLQGKEVGRIPVTSKTLDRLTASEIRWGTGAYGPTRLVIESRLFHAKR